MWTVVTVSGVLLVLFIQTARLQTTSTVPEGEDESSTLAFVIDVTGSMSDDIKQVKEGASRILEKTLARRPRPVQNFVLVPFHDPDIGPVSITTDPKKFQQDLDKLSVGGGGDCPEMSMGGIKKALEVSLPRSFIYVFADASAKDYHLRPDVLKLVEQRQSQVVFVLTGNCGDRTQPGYTAYEEIAASSSGQVFNLGKDKVNEVLKWVEENLQARKVHLLSSNHDGAQENTWELPFDPSLREFTVSLSGPAPQIQLTDPLGHVVGVEQGLIELLNIPNSVLVVNLKFPRPGVWKLKVSSSGQHTLRVTGVSNLDFRAGFSSAPTSDFSSTRERPIEGVPAHVLLKFTGLSPPGQLSHVELVSGSGRSLRNLSVPMPSDRGGRGLWSVPEFHTPSQGFFIKVTGEDDEGYHFQRLSAVSYTNTVTGRTALTTTTVVTTMSPTTTSPTARPATELPEGEDESSTLAFVIDVTGSMSDDIKQVKEGASRILEKTLTRKPRPVQNFVLVPFHDPDIGPVSITTDPKKFQQDLDKLSVGGGGDCPEMSMGGIKKALEVSLPRSFIYVFADASAKDYHLRPDVLKLVEQRQSQVVFVLTGNCGDRTQPGYTAYEEIAASSSGQVFNLGKDKVNEVLKWVEENLQARKVHLLSSNHDGAQENTWELPFDPSLREFTVSLSGPAPQIQLTDPLGHVVGVEQGLIELLNIPNSVLVVNLKFPRPGVWKLKVSSSGQHTLRVTGVSNLDFRAGFSSAPTSDFSSTRERPIEGVPAHVLLKFTGLSPPGQLSHVELVSGSGRSLRNLSVPMPSDRGGRGLWSVPEFHTPSQGFFIKVTGEDDEGYHFQRLSAVSYTNTVTGRTALTTTTVVTTMSPTTTSPTAQPATEPHPLQTAELVCGPSQIQVGLRLASLVSYGLNGSSGHLDERSCSHSTEHDGTVWYRVDRQADTCGNTLTTNSTHAIYSNTLFVYPANPLSSLPMLFPFSCAYPLDTETSLNVLFGRVQALSGLGPHARASMYLFHYSNYTEPYPAGPVTLPRGSTMHVGVSVEWTEKERFGLLLDNCYATASSSHDDSMRHFLIQDKCPSNRDEVRVDESGSSLQAHFSARLQVPYLNIYVHCSVSLCDHTASSCAPVCLARARREPRSVSSTMDIHPLTIGPITWGNVMDRNRGDSSMMQRVPNI